MPTTATPERTDSAFVVIELRPQHFRRCRLEAHLPLAAPLAAGAAAIEGRRLVGARRADDLREQRHARTLVERHRRDFHPELLLEPRDHLDAQERIATELEEVVVDADRSTPSSSCQIAAIDRSRSLRGATYSVCRFGRACCGAAGFSASPSRLTH